MNNRFLCGGLLGDFIHSLYALKNLCKQHDIRARLYIADTSYGIHRTNNFRCSIEETYEYCKDLIMSQDYIEEFAILPRKSTEPLINLDMWRDAREYKTWSRLLSEYYRFPITSPYRWIDVPTSNENTSDNILIHRSLTRKTNRFDWRKILDRNDKISFVVTGDDMREYEDFVSCFPKYNVGYIKTKTLYDLAAAMRGCKVFIGNQSMPFALASALDIPRICELNAGQDERFYLGETEFTANLWFEPTKLEEIFR
jgi:hypothetical protein